MQLLECPIEDVRHKNLVCPHIRKVNGRFICGRTPFPFRGQIPLWYPNRAILMWLKDCEYREEVKAK